MSPAEIKAPGCAQALALPTTRLNINAARPRSAGDVAKAEPFPNVTRVTLLFVFIASLPEKLDDPRWMVGLRRRKSLDGSDEEV